jgi:hypothetical protein
MKTYIGIIICVIIFIGCSDDQSFTALLDPFDPTISGEPFIKGQTDRMVPMKIEGIAFRQWVKPGAPECDQGGGLANWIMIGNDTHLGKFTSEWEYCIMMTVEGIPWIYNGLLSWVAANGDTLYSTIELTPPYKVMEGDYGRFFARSEFTGGTGRFDDAYGLVDMQIVQELLPEVKPEFTMEAEGLISRVGAR